jgi:predicted nuclease of predicted toxin-antitoxin system
MGSCHPPSSVGWLAERGHEAEHVLDLGLMGSGDRHIWPRAVDNGAVIITKG